MTTPRTWGLLATTAVVSFALVAWTGAVRPAHFNVARIDGHRVEGALPGRQFAAELDPSLRQGFDKVTPSRLREHRPISSLPIRITHGPERRT